MDIRKYFIVLPLPLTILPYTYWLRVEKIGQ